MRAFIALELSDEIREELFRLQKELKKVEADVKWVDPVNIHLTLKFMGNVEEGKIGEIKKVFDRVASRNRPFEISHNNPLQFFAWFSPDYSDNATHLLLNPIRLLRYHS